MSGQVAESATLTKKDFVSDQEVRWCPGCGDYSILSQIQKVLPELGVPKERYAFVSGIGCSSRFPYYMNTYGFHTIHGRAAAVATGLKTARPDLSVWVITGDGDGLSIGGNHLIHAIRRNIDLKIVLFNNRIYGLTKGQFSPTSEVGKITKSTPYGSIEEPFNPVFLALACNATFVARTIDREPKHMQQVLRRAAEHKGVAFVEVLQNCSVFNDGAFENITDKKVKKEQQLLLEHGRPMRFGPGGEKGIRMRDLTPEVVTLGEGGIAEDDLLVHDEAAPEPTLALLLARLGFPVYPTPIGVLRAVDSMPYDRAVHEKIAEIQKSAGPVDDAAMQELLSGRATWDVE